eukprot:11618765-Alexandrium_andersonii.AAC.1
MRAARSRSARFWPGPGALDRSSSTRARATTGGPSVRCLIPGTRTRARTLAAVSSGSSRTGLP